MPDVKNIGNSSPEAVYWPLTRDKSASVRAGACQALSKSKEYKSIEALQRVLLKDKSPLVKGYAVLALTDSGMCRRKKYAKEIVSLFTLRYDAEPSDWVRTILLEGLIRLGDLSRFPDLECGLYHNEYRIRLMTVSAMGVLSQKYPKLTPEVCRLLNGISGAEKHPDVKKKINQWLSTLGIA
ncbi:MAG: HEAT repeat domain-containing protein [Oscillospiraceae bacterium]|nr:HEAT repeat domain-containing protein [Oscillospiraceae bacterium]